MRLELGFATFAAALCLVATSCEKQRLRREMKTFMSTRIELPTDLVEIYDGQLRTSGHIKFDGPQMVFFHSRSSCTDCAISHLRERVAELGELQVDKACRVVVLFSPAEEDFLDVFGKIREENIRFPIYVDMYCDFEKLNKSFPDDERFHSFLLGIDGYPFFVGDPLASDAPSSKFYAEIAAAMPVNVKNMSMRALHEQAVRYLAQ